MDRLRSLRVSATLRRDVERSETRRSYEQYESEVVAGVYTKMLFVNDLMPYKFFNFTTMARRRERSDRRRLNH